MDVLEAIKTRRAYRSLEPVNITKKMINDLAECARLAPSCFNNQPWKYIFVYDKKVLKNLYLALSEGNKWVHNASLIIVILGKKEDDCVINDRIYYIFDIGMATANIILRATELDLVAHPIAGYSPRKTREILGIPDYLDVIALLIVGKKSDKIFDILTDKQKESEIIRPKRKEIDEFVYINRYV